MTAVLADSPSAPLLRLLPLPRPRHWHDEALCAQVDPELFFPENGGSTRAPKKVCAACPVQAECLADALERGERYGVWGGMSERERRLLQRPGPNPTTPGRGHEQDHRRGADLPVPDRRPARRQAPH